MPVRVLSRYVARHWRGEQGLRWSFFVNLVALRVALSAGHEALAPRAGETLGVPGLVLALAVHGGVFVWQAVGVLRAAEAHVRDTGSMAPVWGAQLATGVALFWVLSYGWQAWQSTLEVTPPLQIQAETEARRAARYSLSASTDGRAVRLAGPLELGLTKRLAGMLEAHPAAEEVVLSSSGGNIFEARGAARLIRARGLATRVAGDCSSACTTVFIAGTRRVMGPADRLGFHQYRVEADYTVLGSDPRVEQEKDRAAFEAAGVAAWFLDRMFSMPPADIWYPAPSDLVAAGVVTAFAPPPGPPH